jgi:alpha-1,3-rhamnosyl/mannosyltransferase
LKVLFDVRSLAPPLTGIGVYSQRLLGALSECREIDSLVAFSGGRILQPDALQAMCDDTPEPRSVRAPRRVDRIMRDLKAAARQMPGAYSLRQYVRQRQDSHLIAQFASRRYIYHEPSYVPLHYGGPLVITVHDLAHVRHPEFHPVARVRFFDKHLPQAIARADRVLAVSEFVAREIADVYGTSRDKIAVTPLGAGRGFHPREPSEVAVTLDAFGLRYRGFILSVATLEPRKNLARLVDAYASLPAPLRREFPLVLVGGRGWGNEPLIDAMRTFEAAGEILRLGYLPRSQVCELYASAAMVAYPSLYEGFGLPVLEGFASGTPVLTSNTSSLLEVSGGAAIEVDPMCAAAISDGMRRLLSEPSMVQRKVALGTGRSKTFSWERCAKATIEAYRALN